MELSGLNPEQKKAVKHVSGPLLVVAGAGTGKTEVITRRIAYLIGHKLAEPSQILALTFTEKAAGEMLDRLDGLLGWSAHQVNAMTFHAFGASLLIRWGHHGGHPNRAELLTKNLKLLLIRQHLSEAEFSYYGSQSDLNDFINGCIEYIEELQNRDVSVEKFRDYVSNLESGNLVHPLDHEEAADRLKLYELYESLKRRYGLIDYYDQIKLAVGLLKARPNLAGKLRRQYKFVLVDEYQDTNRGQDELLRAFVPPDGNIFAVGDDDQAIYGFRGARIENILNFADHFKTPKPVVLTHNYRSTQEILDRAYRLIRHNDPERLEAKLGLDKRLVSARHGNEPTFTPYPSALDEYNAIADSLADRLSSGQPQESIAVLATTHAALAGLARILRRQRIPHQLVSTIKIFEQKELLQLWHLLRWINHGLDDEAITQLLLGPFWRWGWKEVRPLVEIGRKQLISLEEALERAPGTQADDLVKKLALWREWAKKLAVSELCYKLIFEGGLAEEWKAAAQKDPRMVRVFEDLSLLFRQMQEFENVTADPTLSGYLAYFPAPPEIESEEASGDEGGVALLTVHAAKGLEFETVYLINNTARAWTEQPLPRMAKLPDELTADPLGLGPDHERRRLLYVALTRAKTELMLSAPVFTRSGSRSRVSPFLPEMFDPAEEIPAQTTLQLSSRLDESVGQLERYAPATMRWGEARLPFEQADGWLDLSITDLEKYQKCPYEFYLEKVLKIRVPMGPQIQFGSLLHELFSEYYQAKLDGDSLSLEDLSARLDERWSNRGYRTAQQAESAKAKATQTLELFYGREEKAGRKLLAAEQTIGLTLAEAKLKLRGRMDASFQIEGGIELRDFKTGRLRDQEKLDQKAKESFQLRTYALAIAEQTGQPPKQVVLDYVVTGVEGTASYSGRILDNHRQKLVEIADNIRARKFAPSRDQGHKCVAYEYWGSEESYHE